MVHCAKCGAELRGVADRILVLNEGRVEAEGSHEELLECSPLYRRLCEMQLVSVEG